MLLQWAHVSWQTGMFHRKPHMNAIGSLEMNLSVCYLDR